MSIETITLGGGCFWCTEAVYEQVDGVMAVESGYCNGHVREPELRAGVRRRHRPRRGGARRRSTPRASACARCWRSSSSIHDPTTLNRQGDDIGTQYRSGIYLHDAGSSARSRARCWPRPMRRMAGASSPNCCRWHNYSRAEDYHQRYFANHPGQGYCAFVVAPKVEKFRRPSRSRVSDRGLRRALRRPRRRAQGASRSRTQAAAVAAR